MSRQSPILYTALLLAGLLAALHFLADAHSLYWRFWWYDVMMHFLAGLALGLFAYWGLFASGILFKRERRTSLVVASVVISVFIIGAAWEVFEYANGITDSHEGYALDTTNDLILDCCAAALAAFIGLRKRHG
ncbi:hypothetical protein KW784_00190 [Candidatus Parcubacteria bacterium]|nr:hypothetical protein [Candidatus Parcubacteria bacterium]